MIRKPWPWSSRRKASWRRTEELLAVARQELAARRFNEALENAQRALEERPEWVDALAIALYATAKLERTEAFRELSRTAQQIVPKARPRLSDKKIGTLALLAGAHDLAGRIGANLISRDSSSRVGHYLLASAIWEAGDEPGAERVIANAVAHGSGETVRAAIDYRLRLDDVDGAARLVEAHREIEGSALGDVAVAFGRQGDVVRATRAVRLARRQGLSDPRLDAVEESARPFLRLLDGSWRPVVHPFPTKTSTPGRVLHLVTRSLPYHLAGGTIRNQYVARAQMEAGIDAAVATSLGFPWSHGYVDAPPVTEVDGVTYRHIGAEARFEIPLDVRLARNVEALLPIVRGLRPAALHPASDFRNALVALALGSSLDIPVVYEVRGFPDERLRRRPGSRAWADRGVVRRELERRCALAAAHVVTLGAAMKERLLERGVDPSRITVIPNGVDLSIFTPRPRDTKLAARFGIQADEAVLGYVSSFNAYEGIRYIIEATANLRARGYAARALLVGGGDEEDRLRQLARQLGVASHVDFAGQVEHTEVPRYYSLIDLFICPRRAEAVTELVTPLKPFEAMATGCTVIVSRTRALEEIVDDGVTGRTFKADDPSALAAVCADLIESPEERTRLSTNGRAWVIRERSWTRHGQRYLGLYEELGLMGAPTARPRLTRP